MEILTGGRQSGQNLYNALKLYNYIDSLQNDTTVRVIKKDGICVLCVDESISTQKIKDKIKKLSEIKGDFATCIATNERIKALSELLESEV